MNTFVFLSVIDASSLSFLFAAFIFVKLHRLFSKPNDDHWATQFYTSNKLIVIKRKRRNHQKSKWFFWEVETKGITYDL